MSKLYKTICFIVSTVVALSLLAALIIYLIPEKLGVSVKFVDNSDNMNHIVLFEDELEIRYRKNSEPTVANAVIKALEKNKIEYEYDFDNNTITKAFGFSETEEHSEELPYYYWKIELNSNSTGYEDEKIKDGDAVICTYTYYYHGHNENGECTGIYDEGGN